MKECTITLNEYHVANLKETLVAIGYPASFKFKRSPLDVLNTGDWVGELYSKLPIEVDCEPNSSAEELIENAINYKI